MGHPIVLQAVPADSRLYRLLESDPVVGTIVAQLFNAGGGPYTWAGLDDIDDFLVGMTGSPPTFPDSAAVGRAWGELQRALAEARAAHPCLEQRQAYLDKTQWDIDQRVARELRRWGRADAEQFARAIVFGAEPLTPPGVEGPMGDGLRVVPPALVGEAAGALAGLDPDRLFDAGCEENPDRVAADFRAFAALYSAAAGYGEAVAVGD